MPCPFLIFSQSDYLIQIVDIKLHTYWQTVQIQISWLLQKPTDLDLHCLQKQDISGFSRTRVKVKTSMSCDAKNLIYLIQCSGCQEEYIGETGDTLHHRLTVHRQQIRDARLRMLFVSGHIEDWARNQLVKFRILPLYKMQTDSASARKQKENHFIGLFKSILNKFSFYAYVKLFHMCNPFLNMTIPVTSLPVYNNIVAIDADVVFQYVF